MKTIILMTAAIALAVFAIACNTQLKTTNSNATAVDHNTMDHSTMDHSTITSSQNSASAPYDLQFLDTMIAHHQGAVEMAGPCAPKAQHAEIKTLCADIISSQQKEIAQMRTWREQWFPGKAPAINMQMPGMSDSMKGMDMKALDSLSGRAFDLEFMKQMSPHHVGAVIMAKEALQKSTKDEIKTLAHAIIKAQEAEIAQMKQWQAAWARQ